jgi:hypothetical protein
MEGFGPADKFLRRAELNHLSIGGQAQEVGHQNGALRFGTKIKRNSKSKPIKWILR